MGRASVCHSQNSALLLTLKPYEYPEWGWGGGAGVISDKWCHRRNVLPSASSNTALHLLTLSRVLFFLFISHRRFEREAAVMPPALIFHLVKLEVMSHHTGR